MDSGTVMFANSIDLSTNSASRATDSSDDHLWMMDSGCSHTMTHMRHIFTTFTPLRLPVSSATGAHFWTEGYGEVRISLTNPDGEPIGSMHLQNTWLAPDLAHNLISIRQLARTGIKTVFDEFEKVQLLQYNKLMAHATTIGNHYYLCTPSTPGKASTGVAHTANTTLLGNSSSKPISVSLAHRRTAHASERKLRQTVKNSMGFEITKDHLEGPCEPCLFSKSHKKPVSHSTRSINLRPGDLIVTDVCGPIKTRGYGGSKYFMTFTDVATRYCWTFVISERSEVLAKFKILEKYLRVQHGIEIKRVHADGAGEHSPLDNYLIETGRRWDPTQAYSAVLNGIPEIKNRYILKPVIAVICEYKLPLYLWEHLVLAVVFIKNRLVHDTLGITPYEALQGVQPDLSRLRALGCRCWYTVPKEVRSSKLAPHAAEARFIGYSEGLYKVWDVQSKKIHHMRDVRFDEREPMTHTPSSYNFDESRHLLTAPHNTPTQQQTVLTELIDLRDSDDTETGQPAAISEEEQPISRHNFKRDKPSWMLEYERTGVLPPINHVDSRVIDVDTATPDTSNSTSPTMPTEETSNDTSSNDSLFNDATNIPLPVSRPNTPTNPSSLAETTKGTTTNSAPQPAPPKTERIRASSRVKKPSRALLESLQAHTVTLGEDPDQANFRKDLNKLPENILHALHTGMDSKEKEPTFAEAMNGPDAEKWRHACKQEIDQQLRNGTWKVVPRKKGMRLLPLKWVLKIKHDGRYKARLVAKGFRQHHGKDFHDVFAAVAKAMSVKIFFALSARFGWALYHIDIVTAFLNAWVKEEIYIHLPEGHQIPGMCGRLLRTIYGLKQSGREWFLLFMAFLLSIGFTQSEADHSVFYKHRLYVLVYVDDILLLAVDHTLIKDFLSELGRKFEYTDNGPVTHFLGMDVELTDDGIFLHQKTYIQDCLHRFGLNDCHPVATPFNAKVPLTPNKSDPDPNLVREFQEGIGCLIWIMVATRIDICATVSILSRHLKNPSKDHIIAMNRVWKYLKGSINQTLFYKSSPDSPGLRGFCDADWAGPHSTEAKSTSGYVFLLAGGPISWASKKQTTVALSSTESEYIAMALATQEALWIQLLLTKLNINQHFTTPVLLCQPINMNVDNQSAIALARNPEYHARTKHIHIRYHFLRQQVNDKNIYFTYIPTTQQAADGLTKPLEKFAFRRFLDLVGMKQKVA